MPSSSLRRRTPAASPAASPPASPPVSAPVSPAMSAGAGAARGLSTTGPTQESPLARKRRARRLYGVLHERYPYAHCELDFRTPLELLVATILSAQTSDARVNVVTPTLFARYPTAADYAAADRAELETIVQSTGFYRNKADSLLKLGAALLERFGGEVPGRLADLVTLPGVGRKTANVVLGNAFGVPGITVDTHVGRLARRFGWTDLDDPVKVEQAIGDLVPRADWTMLSHVLIFHGRRTCHARKPACGACPVSRWCPSYGEGETDPAKAEKLLAYELAPGREAELAALVAAATAHPAEPGPYDVAPTAPSTAGSTDGPTR